MQTIVIRNTHADILTSGEVREGEEWQDTLTRLYNRDIRAKGERKRHIALCQSFPGGGTKHVQMGYALGRGDSPTTLDSLVVVQVSEHA